MLQSTPPRRRPRLTLKILLFAILDVTGMVLLSSGALWLARGQALFVAGLPASTAEAIALTVAGLVLMVWAAGRILRELLQGRADRPEEGS